MEQNIIVTLLALNECAGQMFRQPHNQNRYIAPSPPRLPSVCDSTSRETSLSSEGDHSHSSRIQLTFNQGPRNIVRGYTFGRDPRVCDIYLPKSSISSIHFSITYNDLAKLSLIDTSSHGTWVSYNGQRSLNPRHHFTWLLPPSDRIEVEIGINDPVRFALLVPSNESRDMNYDSSLTKYIESKISAGPSLTHLDLSSQETTRRPSRAPSPRRRPWYYRGIEIGRGSYGRVFKARDVTTCTWYAAKEFFKAGWQKEVYIMKGLSHEHIVRYIDTFDDGKPHLIMELLLGNLIDENGRGKFTASEALSILSQGLLALQYLHAQGYAHRDIKPENILVQTRRPLHIKLADFGISQEISTLLTICGTSMYRAPELWVLATSVSLSPDRRKRRLEDKDKTYTTAIDIWALGVVTARLVYDRPPLNSPVEPQDWPKTIIKAVNDLEPDPLVVFLRMHMVVEDHAMRLSAEQCLSQVSTISRQASTIRDYAKLQKSSDQDPKSEEAEEQLPAKKLRRSDRIPQK